jgi:hypothetical protein
MTQAEKLGSLVKRAVKQGYDPTELTTGSKQDKGRYLVKMTKPSQIRGLLFDHDFARALFGEQKVEIWIDDSATSYEGPQPLLGGTAHYPYHEGAGMEFVFKAWTFHLQMAVIDEQPIDYLYGIVFGEKE